MIQLEILIPKEGNQKKINVFSKKKYISHLYVNVKIVFIEWSGVCFVKLILLITN